MELINKYKDILKFIAKFCDVETDQYQQYTDEVIENKCYSFFNNLQNNDLFYLFSEQKIKVFSSKTVETDNLSTCLFNTDLSLKKVLNNRTELIKAQIWTQLYELYIMLETNTERIEVLQSAITNMKKTLTNKLKTNVLKTELNETTNNMIEDIVGSFQSSLNSNSNPMENIMNITSLITEKYQSKIENGEIEIDKLLGSITSKLPGMNKNESESQPIIMDDTFSTADVEVKEEEAEKPALNIGSLLNNSKGLGGLGGLANLTSMMNSVKNNPNDISNMKNQMETMLSSMGINTNDFEAKLEELNKKFNK